MNCLNLRALLLSTPMICAAHGQISFVPNATLLTGNYGSPACVVDMNGDHLDDVVRMSGNVFTVDYQQADGSFVHNEYHATSSSGLWSICAGDLNNDGLNDVLLGDGTHVEFIYNDGTGNAFISDYIPDYIFSQRSTMLDVDQDGWLDAFVCHDVDQNHPYRNDGAGNLLEDQTLVPTGSSPEGGNYAAVWVDYDNDGDQDLYLTKCRSGAAITDERRINQMYRNDSGTFTEVAGLINLKDSAQSWSTVFEDFDNDGDFDAFIVNHTDQNRFMLNDGTGQFTDIIATTGIDANDLGAWEAQAADFDNDGYIDIISEVGGGIYRNNGNLTFTNINIAGDEGGLGDLNNDGYIDYQIGGTIYLNTGGTNHYVKIELDGIVSAQNGIGSRVEIYGAWGVQTREVRSGQGFSHMNSLQVHFGLGSATSIDSLIVHWPSGITTNIPNPSIDQLHIVPEVDCTLPAITVSVTGSTSFCPGDSVTLSAPNGYTSYLWSHGPTTQQVNVLASGNYSVLGFNGLGCAAMSDMVSVSVISESAPVITFSGDLEVCDGDSKVLTAGTTSLPYTWSTGTVGNAISVSQAGDYWLTATGVCGTYNSDTVTLDVLPIAADPVTTGAQIPGPGSATISATGSNVLWYDALTAPDSVGSGNSWTTPFVNTNTTYWAEANEIYGGAPQQGGMIGTWTGGGLPASGGYTRFDAWEDFTIQSVKCYALTAGMRTIQLVDDGGTVLASTQFNFPVGVSTVNLGFDVPTGTDFSLRCPTNDLFRNNNGVTYPYAIGTVGELTGSLNGSSYYYYFYDWVITPEALYCPSARIPAEVELTVGVNDDSEYGDLQVFPNPTADILNLEIPEGTGMTQMELLNSLGQVVLHEQLSELRGVVSFDLSSMESGIYSLILQKDDLFYRADVVISR